MTLEQYLKWEEENALEQQHRLKQQQAKYEGALLIDRQITIKSFILLTLFVSGIFYLFVLADSQFKNELSQRCIAAHFTRDQCAVLAETRR